MLEWGITCCGVAYNGIVYYNMVGRPQSHIVTQALNLLSSSLVILGTCLNFLSLILLKIIEVFVLGALCIAYSGRCLVSGYFNHREPNQGTCTNA